MATNVNRLKTAIKNAFLAAKQETNPENADSALDRLCENIAEAVVCEIKNATVESAHALAAGGYVVTGTITNKVS